MKNKWHLVFAILLAVFAGTKASAQTGIYTSEADYIHNKLSYEGNTAIYVHEFFWNAPVITFRYEGRKQSLKKSTIYGYRNSKNESYRFYNNTEYRIAEAGSIYIYVKEKNIAMSKGYKVVNTYYFSTSADKPIIPMSVGNLKMAYSSNERFRNALDSLINMADIYVFDTERHTFKINYLYGTTITN